MNWVELRQHANAVRTMSEHGFTRDEQKQIRELAAALFRRMHEMGIKGPDGPRIFAGVVLFSDLAMSSVAELARLGVLPQKKPEAR